MRQGAILHFPNGIPGFETSTRFALREQPSLRPIAFLESIDSKELCFLVVSITSVADDYSLGVTAEDLRTLQLDETRQPVMGKEVLVLAILTAPEDGPLTANLLAPLVVNLSTGVGVQAVRADTEYSHRHIVAGLKLEQAC
jgi:flagellar assembly factor FliW